nr:hypothetical protein [Tanacetum cinerariifolium]
MSEPLSPNNVFDFPMDDPTHDFEDPDMDVDEDPEEDPEEVIPLAVASPPRSPPISPPPLSECHEVRKLREDTETLYGSVKTLETRWTMIVTTRIGVDMLRRHIDVFDVDIAFVETMPPRRMRQNAIERLVTDRVVKAIAEYKRNQANAVGAEYKKIERYVWGVPKKIQGNVTSSKPAIAHEAIRMAHSLMDQAVQFKAARSGEANKRKWEDRQSGGNNNKNNRNNTHHHQKNRIQEAAKAYVAAPTEGKVYFCERSKKDQKHLSCMKPDEKKLEDIPIVCNFPKVFPDDLLDLIFESQDMSTSNTHQQSLADASSKTTPPMLERGSYIPLASRFKRNDGNDGRNTRRSYVQEEIIKGNNVQNDVANIQRTLRTTSLGTVANVQCYNCNEKAKQDEEGVILTNEHNEFLIADATRMEEIEELSANICLMARILPATIDSDACPSYESAFLSEEYCENKGKVSTEMELELEQSHQGSSHEVSVSTEGVEELKRIDQTMALQPHSSRVKIQDLMLNYQRYIQDESSITIHYLPKKREVAFAKPYHMIASSNSRISLKNMPRFSSNDMVYNHYLEEAKKKTQERSRNSEPSLILSARSQSTANGSKPKPRINNKNSRNWHASKSSYSFKEFSTNEQAMNSDHNSLELGLHDHSNEQSSSKLVPDIVPPADKTTTS